MDQPLFTSVRLTYGYAVQEVDAFLDQAEKLIRGA
jgi:DivIVA domain-containing protein